MLVQRLQHTGRVQARSRLEFNLQELPYGRGLYIVLIKGSRIWSELRLHRQESQINNDCSSNMRLLMQLKQYNIA